MSIRNLLREANFLELRRDLSSPSEFGSYNHSDVQHPVTHHRGSEGSHYPPFIRNRHGQKQDEGNRCKRR